MKFTFRLLTRTTSAATVTSASPTFPTRRAATSAATSGEPAISAGLST
jgi:hypothetical protein